MDYVPGMPDPPAEKTSGLRDNQFWVWVFIVWILMLIVGFTLALALGIWTLIGAF